MDQIVAAARGYSKTWAQQERRAPRLDEIDRDPSEDDDPRRDFSEKDETINILSSPWDDEED